MNFKTIELKDKEYPFLLREIPNPPTEIYVRGMLPDPHMSAIAIVGTRKATTAGIGIAEEMAAGLAKQGIIIISGLAMGIDTAAHKGALSVGGKTVAVLGNGINEIYPAQNEKLAEEILDSGGAIISEYPPGEPSFKQNFIHRNRIISGLSVAVVVVEAPVRSGALSTAGFAAEQGRNVFVIPGPTTHPNYTGSHSLIRDGATLAAKAADILEDLGILKDAAAQSLGEPLLFGAGKSQIELNIQESLIWETIKNAGRALEVDRIADALKLEPQAVNRALTGLLLKGLIREVNGKYEVSYS
ncbi:MAG: DNA-protecting protein DprA [Candidatus Colwellbacteria bacterium]|nr:DNA-protecting protein DprA [Candidatus Colwellbacteria bacterium]